jgi:predicted aldo/keto reductase-like oxidoreductase
LDIYFAEGYLGTNSEKMLGQSACPKGVAVDEVLRYAMYFENYGMEKGALDLHRQLDRARKPAACLPCAGPCEAAFPQGLAVKAKLVRAQELLEA